MSDCVRIGNATLWLGDCLAVLPTLAANSVDAVVTDPPYELGFMGKAWDKSGVTYRVDLWREVWRVLKPGGHLLAFGGARTYHRLACAIEDAGFEIRDQIVWIYGSGFPKSANISKHLDKMAGAEREVVGRENKKAFGYEDRPWKHGIDADVNIITAPATPAALQWDGWGTALKPAHEPIVVARKPLSEKTVAANVLRWGCGGINVDGGRIETGDDLARVKSGKNNLFSGLGPQNGETIIAGRWPANVIFDEAAGAALDEQSGVSKSTAQTRHNGAFKSVAKGQDYPHDTSGFGDTGGASRFFYCAKASRSEREAGLEGMAEHVSGMSNGAQSHGAGYDKGQDIGLNRVISCHNHHPTVKPLALMRYLCRLITPPGGVILDPFLGSGSTGCAAAMEGFAFVGIEREPEYLAIAEKRIAYWRGKAALPIFEMAECAMAAQ